jgi:hypothetical protein
VKLKRRQKWIEAIKELYSHYLGHDEGFVEDGKDCPFCDIAEGIHEEAVLKGSKSRYSCDFCIWSIMDGVECTDYYDEYFEHEVGFALEDARNEREQAWKDDSIRRLERWARKLNFTLKY